MVHLSRCTLLSIAMVPTLNVCGFESTFTTLSVKSNTLKALLVKGKTHEWKTTLQLQENSRRNGDNQKVLQVQGLCSTI